MRLGCFCKHAVGLETVRSLLTAGYWPAFVIVQQQLRDDAWYGELEALCAEHQVPFQQVQSIREPENIDFISAAAPELILSVLYTEIIPQQIIDIPPLGIVNHHPSLLPAYRGPHPVNWAVINGESETGLTLHFMSAGVDAGDILWQQLVPINFEDDIASVSQRIMALVPSAALEVVQQINAGTAHSRPQNEALASYFPRRTEQDDIVDWRHSARQVYNLIRGLAPPLPGALSWINGRRVVLRKARPCTELNPLGVEPGTLIGLSHGEAIITTGEGLLKLYSIDFEGGVDLDACLTLESFAKIGDRFQL